MKGKRASVDQVIRTLREMEVLQAQGATVDEACRKVGCCKQTFYRGRKEYGRLNPDQAKRLKALERENGRLKRLVADLSLDNAILKDVSSGNF